MKDGRTHLAHKAEHAIDLESGALVAVTLQDADQGDTTTIVETAIAAAEQVEAAHAAPDEEGLHEIVADKGDHSNETMVDLAAVGLRSYISEPARGRRDWSAAPDAQAPVYRNRRRLRGARGDACDGAGQNSPSARLRTYMKPGGCDARICADTRTS